MEDNNNPIVVEMTDSDGTKVKVEVVSHFEDNGRTYVIANDLSNDTDSYILELVSTPEGEMLVSVDSEEEFNRLCESGEINLTNDWTINRYLAGWQDIYTHREDLPNDYDILWDDETDDFDFPADLDRFIKVTGKRLG